MTNLKTLNDQLAAVKVELSATQQRLAEATTRRDALLAEIRDIDVAIEAAENAYAGELAAVELGEKADTDAAAAVLDAARESASRKPELVQRHRVAAAVVENLNRQHAAAHDRYVALTEQHKAAQVAYMESRARQVMDEARDAIAALSNKAAEAAAVRRVLELVGGRWNLGSLEISQYSPIFNPDRNAVELLVAALHREIAA